MVIFFFFLFSSLFLSFRALDMDDEADEPSERHDNQTGRKVVKVEKGFAGSRLTSTRLTSPTSNISLVAPTPQEQDCWDCPSCT
jgi:hypothetical protein